jgi:hypothetical protein
VADKERGNFCDWFSLDSRFRLGGAGAGKVREAAAAAKSAFEDLFT